MKVWNGPSQFDGGLVSVYLTNGSANTKTGNVATFWVLADSENPYSLAKSQKDFSVCGNCIFSGRKGCYVNVAWAPSAIYKTYGNSDIVSLPKLLGVSRITGYGDPFAVPIEFWIKVIRRSQSHLGYTQQWRKKEAQNYRPYFMASVMSESDSLLAQKMGWKTYRVKNPGDKKLKGEIVCPASKEAGRKTNCFSCRLCDGSKKNVVINAHGGRAVYKVSNETVANYKS